MHCESISEVGKMAVWFAQQFESDEPSMLKNDECAIVLVAIAISSFLTVSKMICRVKIWENILGCGLDTNIKRTSSWRTRQMRHVAQNVISNSETKSTRSECAKWRCSLPVVGAVVHGGMASQWRSNCLAGYNMLANVFGSRRMEAKLICHV